MDIRNLVHDSNGVLALDGNAPVSLSLPIGSTIAGLVGDVWLTQEGLTADVVLRAGREYRVVQRGSIVLNSLASPARVRVTDVHAQAKSLRQREFKRVAHVIARRFARFARTFGGTPTIAK